MHYLSWQSRPMSQDCSLFSPCHIQDNLRVVIYCMSFVYIIPSRLSECQQHCCQGCVIFWQTSRCSLKKCIVTTPASFAGDVATKVGVLQHDHEQCQDPADISTAHRSTSSEPLAMLQYDPVHMASKPVTSTGSSRRMTAPLAATPA